MKYGQYRTHSNERASESSKDGEPSGKGPDVPLHEARVPPAHARVVRQRLVPPPVPQQPLDGARSVVEAGLELPGAPVEGQPGENDLAGFRAADAEPRHPPLVWAPDYRLSQQKIIF